MQAREIFVAILQAPAGEAAEEFWIVCHFGAELVVFGKLRIAGGLLLGIVEREPFAGDLDSAKMPVGFSEIWDRADGARQRFGTPVILAGNLSTQCHCDLLACFG